MGQYVTADEVKKRLLGKIKFSDDDADPNAVGSGFLGEVIAEAEMDIEMRLSVRYDVPFATIDDGAFSALPTYTQNVIKNLCRMAATHKVLAYDFGRGSAVNGEEYAEPLLKLIEKQTDMLLEKREGTFNMWFRPPLPGLKLAPHNAEADDGYAGRLLVFTESEGGYAKVQTPSPGETIWNGTIEDWNP